MINEFSTSLSSQLKEIRDLSDGAKSHILNAKGGGADTGAELAKAAANNRRIGEILRNFKLKNDRQLCCPV